MKRDMDLVRNILLCIEEGKVDLASESSCASLAKPYDEIMYHIQMMKNYGLIEATILAPNNKASSGLALFGAPQLSWEGHDFLDDIRSETVWKKTQAQIKKTTGTASLEMVKEVAKTFVREMLLGGLA